MGHDHDNDGTNQHRALQAAGRSSGHGAGRPRASSPGLW